MSKIVARFVCAAALAAIVVGPAQAVPVIQNGSFEDGQFTGAPFDTLNTGNTSITGWSIVGSVDWIGDYWQPKNGQRSLDMNGFGLGGTISQLITGLTANQQYTISFWISGNPDNGPDLKTLVLTTSVDSQNYSYNTGTNGTTRANMNWIPAYFTFTADGDNALLKFSSSMAGSYGMALDYVSIAATPLPAALPLFGSALGAFGLLGWFRRRAAAA
jgi:choice-of-anchor C domain-containing protein